MTGAERLCRALYDRAPGVDDTIGGLDARLLHDAAAVLEEIFAAAVETGAVICIPVAKWTAAWPEAGR